jgi:hypothetical protein
MAAPARSEISLLLERMVTGADAPKPITHAKADDSGAAALAAIEVVIWQLLMTKSLAAEPLAQELERYAHLHPSAAKSLALLSEMVRAAAPRKHTVG